MKLYRCYDNRFRPTERSPALYGVTLETTDRRSESINGRCDEVLEIIDTNEASVLQFGQLPHHQITMDWLWGFSGQVKVICTEFHEGVHYAKRPEHFLPIIDHLEQLHRNDYVHGDIRAYNMVLNYPESIPGFRTTLMKELDKMVGVYERILDFVGFQGWLIDFDYGGKITTNERINPIYPKGYAKTLDDGLRKGIAGILIYKDDDWYALGNIIFECHVLERSDADEAKSTEIFNSGTDEAKALELEFYKDKDKLNAGFPKYFKRLNGNYDALDGGPANFLRDYLQLASYHNFYFIPQERFKRSLEECNMLKTNQRNDSKGATGSPSKNDINADYNYTLTRESN